MPLFSFSYFLHLDFAFCYLDSVLFCHFPGDVVLPAFHSLPPDGGVLPAFRSLLPDDDVFPAFRSLLPVCDVFPVFRSLLPVCDVLPTFRSLLPVCDVFPAFHSPPPDGGVLSAAVLLSDGGGFRLRGLRPVFPGDSNLFPCLSPSHFPLRESAVFFVPLIQIILH